MLSFLLNHVHESPVYGISYYEMTIYYSLNFIAFATNQFFFHFCYIPGVS